MSDVSEKVASYGFKRSMEIISRAAGVGFSRPGNSDLASDDFGSSNSSDKMQAERPVQRANSAKVVLDGTTLWPLPGLAPMTRVRTEFGDVPAVALRKGDKVLLKTEEYRAIEWISRIQLDEHILNFKPDSNPVHLAPGSLGHGAPMTEIMVSPRQIICADDALDLPKPREAATLLTRAGVRRFPETGLTYTMLHVGEAADVYCEGIYMHFPMETRVPE